MRFLLAFQTGAAVPRPNVVLASVLVMLQYVSQQMPIEHTAGYAASIGIDRGSHRRDAIPVESGIWNKNSVLGIYSICAAMAQKYHHEKPR